MASRPAPGLDSAAEPISLATHRRGVPITYVLRQKRNHEMLSRALNMRTTVAFVGAGCSVSVKLPRWDEFTKSVIKAAKELVDETRFALRWNDRKSEFLGHSENFERVLEEGPNHQAVSGEQLRFMLGFCKRVFDWIDTRAPHGKPVTFPRLLVKTFRNEAPAEYLNSPGVHSELLQLPLHRFITSNYDLVLEQFLAAKLNLSFDKFVSAKSFSQEAQYSEQLARFAIGGTEESRNMVFHCHGWWKQVDSMILTEEDYQRWYLSEASGAGPSFRQTIELLFGSHPILFLGFSLRDPDLLMALRSLSAAEPERKPERQLFALLEESEARDEDQMDRLYDQFGVNVIGFPTLRNTHGDPDLTRSLVAALSDLRQRWGEDRDAWLQKPRIRKIRVHATTNQYWHHEFLAAADKPVAQLLEARSTGRRATGFPPGTSGDPASDEPKTVTMDSVISAIRGQRHRGPKLIILVGDGGSGKSWFASRLLKELAKSAARESGEQFFFWSAYHSDDALTGLDRAINFFLPEAPPAAPRLEYFLKCLEGNSVPVYDGIERFLRSERKDPRQGVAPNIGAREFLKAIAEVVQKQSTHYRGTLVLTTRLLPLELDTPQTEVYEVAPMTVSEARAHTAFKNMEPSCASALVSLLSGHRYAFELASLWATGRDRESQVRALIRELSEVGPQRRVSQMIEATIASLDRPSQSGIGPYRTLVGRLSVFMSPISDSTFDLCHDLAKGDWEVGAKRKVAFPSAAEARSALLGGKLVFEVKSSESDVVKYAMHPLVREFAFHRIHHANSHSLPNFGQSGFTSATGTVDPGKEGIRIVTELFSALRRRCREALKENSPTKARAACHEAFSVLRSRTLANTVPRWGSYDEHIHHLVRMADLAKEYCSRTSTRPNSLLWDYCDASERSSPDCQVLHEDGPLFGDELAWLYHELGLAFFEQGSMLDSLSIWEQGYEINKFLDDARSGGQYQFQSCCNLGAASIQHGRLRSAQEYLTLAKNITRRIGEPDHEPRLDGYIALISHLRGDLAVADEGYRLALKALALLGNARAESIFLRHRADLKIKLRDYPAAREFVRSSRAKAEENNCPDLVAYARLTEGHLLRAERDYQGAIREYREAMDAAKMHGIRSLEADAHSEMARLAHDLGDTSVARLRAIKALQIATELHLGLRQTHALCVLGISTVEAGQRDLGIAYLKLAKDFSHQQQYWLRAREAEEQLHRLGTH